MAEMTRRTRIICTIGPASRNPAILRKLVEAGMDVARLNFSHGTHEEHAAVIRAIREGETDWGRPVTIIQDLQGPKVRLGNFIGGRAMLMTGELFTLTAKPVLGTSERASLDHPDLIAALKPGDQLWMDDGTIQLAVERADVDSAVCRVIAGGVVSDHKGVALPGIPLPVSCLTDKDREDLRFGVAHGVDYVAVSFVRSAADIQEVRKFLLDRGASVPIIAKLERAEVVSNLPGILALVDAVMVARGDLGVEVPLEVSDVATAIFEGADAIMLSAETASGQHPVEAVEVMSRVATRIERELPRTSLPAPRPEAYGFSEAVAEAACRAAEVLRAKAIVAFTQSGFSARLISSERPHVPVVALTPFTEIQRRLGLYWGVRARLVRKVDTTDEMLQEVESTLLEDGTVRNGDVLVIISGGPMWVTGTTNLLKLHRVGERP